MKLICNTSLIRLDLFISYNVEDISKNKAKQACLDGKIRVNGKIAKPGKLLNNGDLVEFVTSELNISDLQEAKIDIPIIYQDEYLIVVDKPDKVHCLRLNSNSNDTIADYLFTLDEKFKNVSSDHREAGLVHRLDYYSSGLLLAAKNKDIWNQLRKQIREKKFTKKYYVLVEGKISENQEIKIPIYEKNNKPIVEKGTDELSSTTKIKVLKTISFNNKTATILDVLVENAKRHQIRAHLSWIGHPLVGDELYGSQMRLEDTEIEILNNRKEGFFLDAYYLAFAHPTTGEMLEFNRENPLLDKN